MVLIVITKIRILAILGRFLISSPKRCYSALSVLYGCMCTVEGFSHPYRDSYVVVKQKVFHDFFD